MTKENIAAFICQWIAKQKGLNTDDIDVDENFFQAGWVDSLGMFRLIFELEGEFNCTLDQSALFCNAYPSVNMLADQVFLQLNPCAQ